MHTTRTECRGQTISTGFCLTCPLMTEIAITAMTDLPKNKNNILMVENRRTNIFYEMEAESLSGEIDFFFCDAANRRNGQSDNR